MEFGSKCREYSHKKINWKMAFAKWMLFCFGLNLLSLWPQIIQSSIAMLHNHLRIECRTTDKWGQGWGPLSQFCCVPYFPVFLCVCFFQNHQITVYSPHAMFIVDKCRTSWTADTVDTYQIRMRFNGYFTKWEPMRTRLERPYERAALKWPPLPTKRLTPLLGCFVDKGTCSLISASI